MSVALNWSPSGAVPGSGDIAWWNAASYANAPTANSSMGIGQLLFDTGNTNGVTFGSGSGTLTLYGISGVGMQLNNGSGLVNTGSATSRLRRARPG